MSKPKKERKKRACWIEWVLPTGDSSGGVIVRYYRKEIFKISTDSNPRWKGKGKDHDLWWDAERRCKEWAAKQGFEVIKEKLYR